MRCPECRSETQVVDSRLRTNGTITRRRECLSCANRFSTKEAIVVKQQPGVTLSDLAAQIATLTKKVDSIPKRRPRKPPGPQWPKPSDYLEDKTDGR